jgi:hypothetical protein
MTAIASRLEAQRIFEPAFSFELRDEIGLRGRPAKDSDYPREPPWDRFSCPFWTEIRYFPSLARTA